MPVIAWAPGLVIPKNNLGFFRYSRKYNEIGQRLFAFLARDLFRLTESCEGAGEILFDLSTKEKYDLIGFHYFSNRLKGLNQKVFENSDISNEAKNNELAKSLWNLSSDLLGISSEI